jgi:uncharacterized protein with PIN domain
VPHPEVDVILVDGRPVDFACVLDHAVNLDVYSAVPRCTCFADKRLQETGLEKFIADGHLGQLTRNLRLLGVDVAYDGSAQDRQLLEWMTAENRALLTRDRRLLMHKVVRHGYYPRSQDPLAQTDEVLRRFALVSHLAPFTRCLRCNSLLRSAAKEEVIDQLEPLTRVCYEEFRRCIGCGHVYWRGSHFDKLRVRVEEIRARLRD